MDQNVNTNPNTTKKNQFIIILLLMSITVFSAVMVSPALPELKDFFHLAGSMEEIVVAVFIIGYAIGSLFYGPLANRYGRKKALYIGLGIHLLGLLFSNLSYPFESFSMLLVGRFLSSFGSSAGMVIGIILINDMFEGERVNKMMSYAIIATPIAMGVAMTVGGFLTESFAWVSCFQVQFGYGILVLVLATRLKETLIKVDPGATKIKSILHGLKECFSSKRLIGFSIVGGVTASLNYLFASASPIISEGFFNLAPQQYGVWTFTVTAGFIAGALLSARLVTRINPMKVLSLGIWLALFFSALFIAYYFMELRILWLFFMLAALITASGTLAYPNAISFATGSVKNTGNASSVFVFIAITTAFIVDTVMSFLPTNAFLQYVITLFAISLLAVVLIMFLRKGQEILSKN